MSLLLKFVESSLDLVCDSLAPNFSTIVGEASSVALGDQDVKVRIALFDASREVLQVVRVAPKTAALSA